MANFSKHRLVAASASVLLTILVGREAQVAAQGGSVWQFENIAQPASGLRTVPLAGFDFDPDGRPVVAWREESGSGLPTRVFWTRKEGGVWNANEFLSERRYDGGGKDGVAHRMILRPSDGHPFLVYRDVAPGNYLNTYRTDLGAHPTGGVSDYLEGLVGPQNCASVDYALAFAPAASFPDWATGLALCNGIGPVRLDGLPLTANAVEGAHPGLTVTPDGTRHMLWSSGRSVYYTRWPTGDALPTTSATPLFADISSLGGEVRMASDASGVVYAAIRGVEGLQGDFDLGAVVYIESRDGGQTWTPFQYVDPLDDAVPNSNGANSDISLAVDAAGIPAVTYWRSRQQLWYARRDGPGGTWTRSLVTTMAYSGQPYSAQLRFDANNDPVVAYYDHNANLLRLARPVPSGVTPPIDIAVTGTAAPAASQPGAPLTFTLTVTNRGTTNVDHVVLSNALPPGVTLVDASPRPDAGGRWPLGLLTSGASATITVSATAPATPGDIVDVASVTSDGTDAVPGNNAAAIGMTVRPVECLNPALAPTLPACGVAATSGLDVAASVTSMPNPVVVNGLFTFVVKATNVGTVDAVGVTVTNTLPPGLTLLDGAPAPPGDVGDEQVYTLESLPVGTSAWFVIRTIAPFADTVVDRARVSVAGDVNAANDTASTPTVVQPDACFVAPAGLVSRWRGDGNALDSVGTHHGQPQGIAAFSQGRQGQAFSFDGISQSIVMPDSPGLRPVQFTVSAWIYPESLRGSYDVVFSAGHSLWLGFSSRRLTLYTHEFGESLQVSTPVQPNQWHLLTASYDGVAQRLYLDGVKVAERVVNRPMTYGPPEVAGIGGYWYYGQLQSYENFHGLIDEVTLHNRALGDAEVRGLYDGSSPSCPPPNHPPAITNPGDQSSAEGTAVSLPIAVQDGDGDALTYGATGLPPGLALAPTSSGVDVAGPLGFLSAGPYDVTLTVGDGTTTRTSRFLWTVTNVACTPLAFPDSAATPMNTPIEIHVIDNDPLPSACRQFGVPVLSDVTQPAHGSVVLDGKFSTAFYTPAPNFAGVDTFTYSIANSEGSVTATVTVVVSSPVPPTVIVPADMLVEATASSGATVTFVASATDATGAPLTPLCLPPSGTVFAIGATVVTCAAADALGLTSQNAFSVTVRDSTGPALSIPDSVTTAQTGAGGAVVTFTVSAVDSVDNTTTAADCVPASGSTFPIGTTVVTCSATDVRGNTSTETFDVTVMPAVLQCLAPTQGLASWWPGNDSAVDVVGGRSGVLRGGVTYGPGVNRSAFVFDGASGYVEVPTANDNDLYPQNGAFTLSAWVKTTSLDTMAVVAKDECANGCASTSVSKYVLLLDQGYPLLWLENANGENYLLNAWPGVRGFRFVADGAFHHIMVVRDLERTPVDGYPDFGEVRLYIDGEYSQFVPSFMTGSLQDDDGVSDPLTIGGWKFRGEAANYFNGAIDDVLFYRRALTAAEAFGMFTQRSTGQCHGSDNRAPILETPLDQPSIEGEAIIALAVSATDTDGDTLGYSATGLPFGLSIDVASGIISGTLTAAPGQYSVTATVSDGSLSDSKTFLWTVIADCGATCPSTNHPPETTMGDDVAFEGTPIFRRNFVSDPDGDAVQFSVAGLPPGLTAIEFAAGAHGLPYPHLDISGTPPAGSAGPYPGTLTMNDGTVTVVKSLVWTVRRPNRSPVAQDDGVTTVQTSGLTIPVLANDSDPDGDPITLTNVSAPADGDAYVDHTSIVYRPRRGGWYTDSFSYTIDDGHGGSATAQVTVRILSPQADLVLTMNPPSVVVRPGQTFAMSVVVTNQGSVPIGGAVVTAQVPNDLQLADVSSPPEYPGGSDYLMGAMAAGESKTLTLQLVAPAQPTGRTSVWAEVVSRDDYEPPQNNTASVSVIVQPDFCFAPPFGRQGMWRFDGDLFDAQGRWTAAPGDIRFAPSRVGQSVAFSGEESSFISFPNQGALRFPQFTLAAWSKRSAAGNQIAPVISDRRSSSGNSGAEGPYWFGFQDGYPVLEIYEDRGVEPAAVLRAPQRAVVDSWTHIAATYDGAVARLFVNGVEVAHTDVIVTVLGPGYVVFGSGITSTSGVVSTSYAGLLDDVAIYDRALSGSELQRMVMGDAAACAVPTTRALSVTLSALPSFAQTSGAMTFEAIVTNASDGYLEEVELEYAFDPMTTLIDAQPAAVPPVPWLPLAPTRWTIGPLVGGESRTITIWAMAPPVDGHFVNHARAYDVVSGISTESDQAFTVAAEVCFVTPTGLVAQWHGEPNDPSNASLVPLNDLITYVPGRVGQTFDFSGNYFTVPRQVVTGSPFTVGSWIRVSEMADQFWQAALMVTDDREPYPVTTEHARVFLGLVGGVPTLLTQHEDGSQYVTQASSQVRIALDTWHHFAASWDGSEARLYLDGVPVARQDIASPLRAPQEGERLLLGFNVLGLLDEMLVYDRALTNEEVRHFVDGSPDTCAINARPTLENPGAQHSRIGDTVSLQLVAADPDSAATLTYSAAGLPHGLTVDSATGILSGVIASDAWGLHTVSVTVSDGSLSALETFEWTVPVRLTVQLTHGGVVRINEAQVCDGSSGPATCSWEFDPGLTVMVSSQPPAGFGSAAVWWTEDQQSTWRSSDERVTLTASRNIDVAFLAYFVLTVNGLEGDIVTNLLSGSVPVVSEYQGATLRDYIYCPFAVGPVCSGRALIGSVVQLFGSGSVRSRFDGFDGACTGFDCSFTVDRSDIRVSANYHTAPVPIRLDVYAGGSLRLTDQTHQTEFVCEGPAVGMATCIFEVPYGSHVLITPFSSVTGTEHWSWVRYQGEPGFTDDQTGSITMTRSVRVGVSFWTIMRLTIRDWVGLSALTVPPVVADPSIVWNCSRSVTDFRTDCEARVPRGSSFMLTPTPGELLFKEWSGPCAAAGTGACRLTLTEPEMSAAARFAAPLTVQVSAGGAIVASPTQRCDGGTTGRTCLWEFPYPASVPLSAVLSVPGAIWRWDDAPGLGTWGPGPEVKTVNLDRSRTVSLTFLARFEVQRTVGGLVNAQLPASPYATFSAAEPLPGGSTWRYRGHGPVGSTIRLTVVPIEAYAFARWTGDCTGLGPCDLVITRDEVGVQAAFLPIAHADVFERIRVTDSVFATPQNTPVGNNVTAAATGPQGGLSPISVTFSAVTQPGNTTFVSGQGVLPPDGFQFGTPPVTFDISTTAVYTAPLRVCINYGSTVFLNPSLIRLFHYEGASWVDRTVSVNTATHSVCASVSSLSPFAIAEPENLEGRMHGDGTLIAGGKEYRFDFRVAEPGIGRERGALDLIIRTPQRGAKKDTRDAFESTEVDMIAFWDDPAFGPGWRNRPQPPVDSAVFTGTGKWNGTRGYTFEARAADEGEPGRGRDRFTVTIRDASGAVVANVDDVLNNGNIQSERLRREHWR